MIKHASQLVIQIVLVTCLLVSSGFKNSANADSRPAFGGRAAAVADEAPAGLVSDAQSSNIYLFPTPAAGDETANDKTVDDDYFDNEFTTSLSGDISDPLEPWNRFWFGFNDIIWRQYAQPIWISYELVTPVEFRQGVSNFFDNLAFPIRFINCLLQGKPMEAGVEFSRFIVNSTLGVGGLMKPAAQFKPLWCEEPDVDGFGQTLGRWGFGDGVYIVWPLLGPSTVRESFGMVGDFAAHPLTYASIHWENGYTNTVVGLRAGHALGENLDTYSSLRKISVEPYTALRSAYVQNSRSRVQGIDAPDF